MKTRRSIIFQLLIWLALGSLAYGLTYSFDNHLENYRYGAASWPRVIILGMVMFALIQAILDLVELRRHGPLDDMVSGGAADTTPEKTISGVTIHLKRLATFGVPLLFLFMIPRMGYYVSAPFFITAFMLLLGERQLKHLIGTSLLIYCVTLFVFTKLLFVPLPEGTWPGFYEVSSWIIVLLT
ncbi:MAG: tripartite tricarboxylate transporter TctB family protein [Deltaproteobacteria bacterium]|nr:tripartite tricarboxylate transporter TctB family protein [Deltaproteobacteria bacterium]